MVTMNECIFCKIIRKEIPADIIYEDEHILSFLDIAPSTAGHCLVIPKEHFENIYTLPDETLCRVSMAVKHVSILLRNSLECEGINIVMNNEALAGQVVFHAHIHIMPRYTNDGLKTWGHRQYQPGEKEAVYSAIQAESRSTN